jgi:hypothetical protein
LKSHFKAPNLYSKRKYHLPIHFIHSRATIVVAE